VEVYEKVGYSTPEALEPEVFNHKSPGTFFLLPYTRDVESTSVQYSVRRLQKNDMI
jgi:hypothetical protein